MRPARPARDLGGQRDVVVVEGHDRRHVERADARVRAAVAAQVDAVDALAGQRDQGVLQRQRLAGDGEDAAVVVGVGVDVEHPHAGHAGRRRPGPAIVPRVAPLADVGDGVRRGRARGEARQRAASSSAARPCAP